MPGLSARRGVAAKYALNIKGLGSLTNNFGPANFEKINLQRALKCFNDYKI